MQDWISWIAGNLGSEQAIAFVRAFILVVVGLALARVVGGVLTRVLSDRLDAHRTLVLRRAVVYAISGLFLVSALRELGFQLSLLLGAAGILTIAIGFASQTSAANVVSGLFLLGERPFAVGDVIRIGGTTGQVLSIDLLAAKLRTFDNLYVRIPNEALIKSEITNLTRFPIRRLDLPLSVAYKEDLTQVSKLLIQVADGHPLCLEEPRPLVILTGYGDSGITIQFSVWTARQNFLEVRNAMYTLVKERLDAAGIEIPFPHLSLYRGSATEPLPIQLVNPAETPTEPAP